MNIEHFLKEIKRIKTQYETQKDRCMPIGEILALPEDERRAKEIPEKAYSGNP